MNRKQRHMKVENKIFLDKENNIDFATDRLLSTTATKVVLNIPKNSVLGISVHNFQMLKREADTAGKEIIIESIDEHVLELASLVGMTALNPVFKTKERIVTDILPRGNGKSESRKARSAVVDEEITEFASEETEKEEAEDVGGEEYVPPPGKRETRRRREEGRKSGRIFLWGVVLIAGLAAIFLILTYVIPHVTIQVSIKKITANFSDTVVVSPAVASSSLLGSTVTLPGQIISAASNLSFHFASGTEEYVQTKATGTLVVYNAYSSASQILVATTRFVSPEGKLFRSTERVTVPGAKIANGTTTPGSTKVPVVADQPGSEYNVGPSDGWTIPGFQGTARYDKFYAAALQPMGGGFVGTTTVPTKDDLAAAENQATQKLEDALTSQLSLLNSDNLTILPQSTAFQISSMNATPSKDGNGFDVYVVGSAKQMAFDGTMFQNVILDSLSNEASGTMKVDEFKPSYSTTTPDFIKGTMSFTATGTITYEPNIDFNKVKSEIVGMTSDKLKATIFALPGLEQANVSFWPFWVSTVPTNQANINLEVQ